MNSIINIDSIRMVIREWFEDEFNEICKWKNEYGYIWTNKEYEEEPAFWKLKRQRYKTGRDFHVHLWKVDDIICFKILPSGATPENCPFLSLPKDKLNNIHWFDGVVSQYDKNDGKIWSAMHESYVLGYFFCIRKGWDLSHSFETSGIR